MSGSHLFILAIIAMAFGYGLIKSWVQRQPQQAPESSAEADEMLNKIETLEERIRVLERIVTDGNHDLKRKIDDL